MTKNPIVNAIELVRASRLVKCNRCGAPDLAWVQSKQTSRWFLVNTSRVRPFYHGENQPPEAPQGYIYAVKPSTHNCQRWQADQAKLAQQLVDLQAYQSVWRNENGHTAVEMLQKALVEVWLHDCPNELKSNPPQWIQASFATFGDAISASTTPKSVLDAVIPA